MLKLTLNYLLNNLKENITVPINSMGLFCVLEIFKSPYKNNSMIGFNGE